MPTVLREGPYQFRFVSFDCNEPPHVHVVRDKRDRAKVWVEAAWSSLSGEELRRVLGIIEEHHKQIVEAWYAHCGEERENHHR